jgi:hypothetical protein
VCILVFCFYGLLSGVFVSYLHTLKKIAFEHSFWATPPRLWPAQFPATLDSCSAHEVLRTAAMSMPQVCVSAGKEPWDLIAQDLAARKEEYLDDDFSTIGASLYFNPAEPPAGLPPPCKPRGSLSRCMAGAPPEGEVIWLRPGKMAGVTAAKLFIPEGEGAANTAADASGPALVGALEDAAGMDFQGMAPADVIQGSPPPRPLNSTSPLLSRAPISLSPAPTILWADPDPDPDPDPGAHRTH